jgi:hypothetical protein
MHTSTELDRDSFAVSVDGAAATIADLLPGFSEHDRIGIVVDEPCGGVGASCLVLAAVTAFYDIQRSRGEDFFIYPDYFVFHAGRRIGDYGMLDVWPDHKEVEVAGGPEQMLRAINDRAITRLLVPDGEAVDADFDRHTLASAESRIVGAFAYAPSGRVADADVVVAGDDVTESYVAAVLDPTATDPDDETGKPRGDGDREANETWAAVGAQVRAQRAGLRADGRPSESYRRITLQQALGLLGRDQRSHAGSFAR